MIKIDTAYKTVYEYDKNQKAFLFKFKYFDKKNLIKRLKEEKEIKADGRTSYYLIERRYNK